MTGTVDLGTADIGGRRAYVRSAVQRTDRGGKNLFVGMDVKAVPSDLPDLLLEILPGFDFVEHAKEDHAEARLREVLAAFANDMPKNPLCRPVVHAKDVRERVPT